jgi:hypothetical protein
MIKSKQKSDAVDLITRSPGGGAELLGSKFLFSDVCFTRVPRIFRDQSGHGVYKVIIFAVTYF